MAKPTFLSKCIDALLAREPLKPNAPAIKALAASMRQVTGFPRGAAYSDHSRKAGDANVPLSMEPRVEAGKVVGLDVILDGNISNYATATNPYHIYTSAGTYSVNLTVTNAGGSNSLRRANYITVTAAPPAAPVASFTGTPTSGTAPRGVTFTDSSTGTSITNRRWDFGDGNISNYATATNPYHIYTSAGTYSVNLTVTNAGGSNSHLQANYITVTAAPPAAPVAAFTGTPTSGTAPRGVTFTDSSTTSRSSRF